MIRTYRLSPSSRTLAIFCTFVGILIATNTATGQRFDVEEYLKKIDKNQNGVLEESEMSGRTKSFIERMGFETDKPVSIRKVVSKVNKDREERDRGEKSGENKELRVPGFAVEKTTERNSVVGFTTSSDPSSSRGSVASTEVSEDIKKQVRDALDRYDRNKDGILDEREIRDGRWGTPSPAESDKNRDGKLSQDELTQRYIERQRFYNKDQNDQRSSSRGSAAPSKEVQQAQAAAQAREQFRRSGTTSSSSSRSSRSSGFGSRSSSRSSTSSSQTPAAATTDTAKYEAYANGLISQYDTNKNGALDKDEIANMRRPPKADANGDGTITKAELIDQLTGKSSASPAASEGESKASTSSSRSSGGSSRSSGSTRRTSRSSGSFDDLDTNKDGRIHMYEFSKEWTEELVEKFNEKDKNGDGIISQQEWNSTGS